MNLQRMNSRTNQVIQKKITIRWNEIIKATQKQKTKFNKEIETLKRTQAKMMVVQKN